MCVTVRLSTQTGAQDTKERDDFVSDNIDLRLICPLLFSCPGNQQKQNRGGLQAPALEKKVNKSGEKAFSTTTFCCTMGARLHLPAVANTLLPVAFFILTLLPHSLQGNPAEEENTSSSPLLQRVKRGWVWNQFFVLEEYTGLEPLYIGKVSV